jgi:hypothetical protein
MHIRRATTFLEELFHYYRSIGKSPIDETTFSDIRYLVPPEEDPNPSILWIGKTIQSFAGYRLASWVTNNISSCQLSQHIIKKIQCCRWSENPIRSLSKVLHSIGLTLPFSESWTPRRLRECWPILSKEASIQLSKAIKGDEHPLSLVSSVLDRSTYRQLIIQELLQQVNLYGYEVPTSGDLVDIVCLQLPNPNYITKSTQDKAMKVNGHITLFTRGANISVANLMGSISRIVALDLLLDQIENNRLSGCRLPNREDIITQSFKDESLDTFFGDTPTIMELYESSHTEECGLKLLINEMNPILRSLAARNIPDNKLSQFIKWWNQNEDTAALSFSMAGDEIIPLFERVNG